MSRPLLVSLLALGLCWGCDDPAALEDAREKAAAEGREAGRAAGFEQGYADGLRRGRTDGLAEGRSQGRALGRSEAIGIWTPVGFGAGLLLGLGVVAVVAREPLGRAIAERRRVARLRRWLRTAPPKLHAERMALLEDIGRRRQALDDALTAARTDAVRALAPSLAPRLDRLARRVVQVAEHLDRRVAALDAIGIDPDAVQRRIDTADAADAADAADSTVAQVERDRLDAWRRARAGVKQARDELDAAGALLDRLRIDALELDAREGSGSEGATAAELGAEVDALAQSLTELSDP